MLMNFLTAILEDLYPGIELDAQITRFNSDILPMSVKFNFQRGNFNDPNLALG